MRRQVSFAGGGLTLRGDLHLPVPFDGNVTGPAVVLSTPGSSVKEQIGANYASRLAERGLPALTFDPAHQGASDGVPRDVEDPYRRGADISYAIDFLAGVAGIDSRRIGVLGICAGGGYAVHTARTDHRIRALGTVVATNLGAAWRSPAIAPAGPAAALDELAAERISGDDSARVNWLPDTLDDAHAAGIDDRDTLEAIRYYRTPRGQHANSTNRRFRQSDSLIVGYDAFHLVDQLLTQPLQVVVAGRRGSTGQYETGLALADLAPNAGDPLVVEGAGHYEMYDEPRFVDQAIEGLTTFYREHL